MTPPNIAIDSLANCPEFVGELARLSWKEWQEVYEQRKQTLDHSLKNYRERMNTDRLPLTLVAVHSGELVGMVSLKFHDMDTRPDLDPWLGGLLVLPEWRNRGVGTMLMLRATEQARRLMCHDSIFGPIQPKSSTTNLAGKSWNGLTTSARKRSLCSSISAGNSNVRFRTLVPSYFRDATRLPTAAGELRGATR